MKWKILNCLSEWWTHIHTLFICVFIIIVRDIRQWFFIRYALKIPVDQSAANMKQMGVFNYNIMYNKVYTSFISCNTYIHKAIERKTALIWMNKMWCARTFFRWHLFICQILTCLCVHISTYIFQIKKFVNALIRKIIRK